MGLFDVDNKWFFGGLFDFNKDGKTSAFERGLAYKIIEESEKEMDADENYDEDFLCSNSSVNTSYQKTNDDFSLDQSDSDWRDFCEDGFDVGIYPDDYETEEEYTEALELAREESYESEQDNGYSSQESEQIQIDFNNLKNKRQYNAACFLSKNYNYVCEEANRCRFILEKSDTVVAARYLTLDGDFLYAQAVNDNFQLPITLPDEDEKREYEFLDIIKKLARKDIPLCFEVWSWCLEQFLDYDEYDIFARLDLTSGVIGNINELPDNFSSALIEHLSKHPDMQPSIIREADKVPFRLSTLIVEAIKMNFYDTAKAIFEDGLANADGKWKPINELMDRIVSDSENYREIETIEYVKQNFLPIIRNYTDPMILEEVEKWEEDIADYKSYMSGRCESTDSEVDYSQESEESYNEESDNEELDNEEAESLNMEPGNDNRNIYTYLSVLLPFSPRPYFFRTNDPSIKLGEKVIVAVGNEQKQMEGIVVSVGQYYSVAVPYPLEATKFIIAKVTS